MRPPLFERALTDEERSQLEAGLRSSDAFVVRRCQSVLASARGARVPPIAQVVGCDEKTVRQGVHGFNAQGVAVRHHGSSRPHPTHPAFTPAAAEALRDLWPRRPRAFGKPISLLIWDQASWHVSQAVRAWIRAHNHQDKRRGHGVRLLVRCSPVTSPWLNPIEPKWVHGKRAIVEPARLLTAQEVAERVCASFDCSHEDHLIQEKVN